jgi:hypothetical protein
MVITTQQIDDDELRRRLQAAATGDLSLAHDFFAQFDYNIYLNQGQFLQVHERTIPLLQKLKRLDLDAYTRIHKGVPFYFTAISSFYLHNYAEAVYFFDAAVSEDLQNDPGSRTPAIMFLEMDGDPKTKQPGNYRKLPERSFKLLLINTINYLPQYRRPFRKSARISYPAQWAIDRNGVRWQHP